MGSKKLYVAIQSTSLHIQSGNRNGNAGRTTRPPPPPSLLLVFHISHRQKQNHYTCTARGTREWQREREKDGEGKGESKNFQTSFSVLFEAIKTKENSLDYGTLESLDWHSINALSQYGYLCEIIVNIIYWSLSNKMTLERGIGEPHKVRKRVKARMENGGARGFRLYVSIDILRDEKVDVLFFILLSTHL